MAVLWAVVSLTWWSAQGEIQLATCKNRSLQSHGCKGVWIFHAFFGWGIDSSNGKLLDSCFFLFDERDWLLKGTPIRIPNHQFTTS